MNKSKFSDIIKGHSTFFTLLLSLITIIIVYPKIVKYTYLVFACVCVLYCFYIMLKKFRYTKIVLLFSVLLLLSLFYCAITYTSFYPNRTKIQKNINISDFTGWGYYNFLAYGLKNKQLNLPIEPSEKLKALKNPYNHLELNENLSWKNFDYIMDLSFYKGKYYIYFGIVPAITVYLPFVLIANNFLPDSLVVLFFSLLTFYLAVFIFFCIYRKIIKGKDFLIELAAVMAIGLCPAFTFLISFPRVYEVAIIMAVFFCMLSFLFIFLYLTEKNSKKKSFFLLISGLCIGLACGCRPFYALIVPVQALIFIDFHEIRKNWKSYAFYVTPIAVCALGLMLYNYARFDSFFEFGNKYQLTIYDISNWKLSFANTWNSVKNYLFFSPTFQESFPYIYARVSSGMWHEGEPVIGMFYLFPFVFLLPGGYVFFKEKSLEGFLKKYVLGILLTGIIILFVVSTMGSLYRFLAEFSIYLLTASLLLGIYWQDKYSSTIHGLMIKYLLVTTVFSGIVFSFASSFSNSLLILNSNMPELYTRLTSFF